MMQKTLVIFCLILAIQAGVPSKRLFRRIVNGEYTPGPLPWMVSIQKPGAITDKLGHSFGGMLIRDNIVLTGKIVKLLLTFLAAIDNFQRMINFAS